MKQLFGQQNQQLLPESWKLNGNIFFELFLSDLDEKKNGLGGLRTTHKGKQWKQAYLADKYLPLIVAPHSQTKMQLNSV